MGEVVQGNTATELNSSNESGILTPEQEAQAAGVEPGAEVPAKFRNEDGTLNQEALLQSYLALESKQGEAPSEEAEEPEVQEEQQEEEQPKPEEPADAQEQARSALNEKGIDPDTITQDFYNNGEQLSDEWYGKLAEAGYPRELVDTYVKGLQAQNASAKDEGAAIAQEVYSVAGDEGNFKQMMDYFEANGGTQHADRYNAALQSQDVSSLKAAVADMYVEYRAAEGVEPVRRVAAADGGSGVGVYRSFAEMKADMANPKYRHDPAFRKDVEAKALRSKF